MAGDSKFHDGMRHLQDLRDTRRLADRLEHTIVHRVFTVEWSAYVPQADYTPSPPVPAWKTFEVFRDALPARDRPSANDDGTPPRQLSPDPRGKADARQRRRAPVFSAEHVHRWA